MAEPGENTSGGWREWLSYGLALAGFMSLLLAAIPVSVLAGLLLPGRRSRPFVRRWATASTRIYLNGLQRLGIAHIDLKALDALRDEPGLVIAPNHPGLLDAFLMISRLPRSVCIMKASLSNNPMMGICAERCGYIRNDSARRMVRQAVEELRAGNQLLVFPEGTRTPRPPIGPLKGAFALAAIRSGAPVQIVLIESEAPLLPKGWPLWRCPVLPYRVRVRLGPRIDARGQTSEHLIETVAECFRRELAPRPAGREAPRAARTAEVAALDEDR